MKALNRKAHKFDGSRPMNLVVVGLLARYIAKLPDERGPLWPDKYHASKFDRIKDRAKLPDVKYHSLRASSIRGIAASTNSSSSVKPGAMPPEYGRDRDIRRERLLRIGKEGENSLAEGQLACGAITISSHVDTDPGLVPSPDESPCLPPIDLSTRKAEILGVWPQPDSLLMERVACDLRIGAPVPKSTCVCSPSSTSGRRNGIGQDLRYSADGPSSGAES